MQSICEVRDNWYQAYKSGDTGVLRKYESPSLVVSVNGVQESVERYSNIEERVSENSWFQPELVRDESLEESNVMCSVSGRAKIMEGKAKGQVLTYSETWKNIGSGWLLETLQINT